MLRLATRKNDFAFAPWGSATAKAAPSSATMIKIVAVTREAWVSRNRGILSQGRELSFSVFTLWPHCFFLCTRGRYLLNMDAQTANSLFSTQSNARLIDSLFNARLADSFPFGSAQSFVSFAPLRSDWYLASLRRVMLSRLHYLFGQRQ